MFAFSFRSIGTLVSATRFVSVQRMPRSSRLLVVLSPCPSLRKVDLVSRIYTEKPFLPEHCSWRTLHRPSPWLKPPSPALTMQILSDDPPSHLTADQLMSSDVPLQAPDSVRQPSRHPDTSSTPVRWPSRHPDISSRF